MGVITVPIEVSFYWYGYNGQDRNRYEMKDSGGNVKEITFDEAYDLACSGRMEVNIVESTFYKSVYKIYSQQ